MAFSVPRISSGVNAPFGKAARIARVSPFNWPQPRSVRRFSGGSGGSGNGKGGGGGGGGGDGSSDEPPKRLTGLLAGWALRVAYDPKFPIKVAIEQFIGVGAAVLGDMCSRPNWGLDELDFVFCTIVVGSILNFSVIYLLAPTAACTSGALPTNFVARALSDVYLKAWGAPGGHMFEPGTFSVLQRLVNLSYKGVVFFALGFAAGIFGTASSNGILVLRRHFDPNFKIQNDEPNVMHNAGTWGLHMAASANLRYQILGGIDPFVAKLMPVPAYLLYQTVARTANNVVGGMSFVTLARHLGVQKSSAEPTTA